MCGPILWIYKSLTDTWMWKLGLRPHNSQKRIHKWNVHCSVFEVFVCIIETHFSHELWYDICWSSFLSLIGKKARPWIEKNFFRNLNRIRNRENPFCYSKSVSIQDLKKSFLFTLKAFPIDGYISSCFTFVHFAKFLAIQNNIKNTIVYNLN